MSAHLRVRLARLRVVALADHVAAGVHEHAANQGVGEDFARRGRRERQRATHVCGVIRGVLCVGKTEMSRYDATEGGICVSQGPSRGGEAGRVACPA